MGHENSCPFFMCVNTYYVYNGSDIEVKQYGRNKKLFT